MANTGTSDDSDKLQENVSHDLGGVQGGEKAEGSDAQATRKAPTGTVADVSAPGGGEIEWAGSLIKKPPAPKN